MLRPVLVTGTMFGAAALLGGLAVQWTRIEPQFKAPTVSVVVGLPTAAELKKQELAAQTAQLQAAVDDAAKNYLDHVAIVATNLKTGVTASVHADQQMVSASLYKLFVGWGIYQKIDAGTLKLTSAAGHTGQNVGQCLDAMITVSDNDCGYALGAMVGWATLNQKLADIGLTQTDINNYGKTPDILVGDKLTSAADIAKFLHALYEGKLLSKQSTDAYFVLLKADELNTWLPSGLPPGTVIAHKTGALDDVVHDAGVVYTLNGDYLIVVMSHSWDNPKTQPPAVFADISRRLWNFFTK